MSETLGAKYIVQEKVEAVFLHAEKPVLQVLPQVESVEPRRTRVTVCLDATERFAEYVELILEKWPPRLNV